jgi:hypothetical protein
VAEIVAATVSCTMLHVDGAISSLGDNEAAKQHAHVQLAVAAQSAGGSCSPGSGAYAFMHSL